MGPHANGATANAKGGTVDAKAYARRLDPSTSERVLSWLESMPASCLGRCTLTKLPQRHTLVRMLDRCDRVYLLCRGSLCTTSGSPDGSSYVIDDFSAPAIFGEMEVIGGQPFYHGTLTATKDCELISMPRAEYIVWLLSDARIALERSRQVVASLARQSSQERSLLSWNGTQRIVYALCQRISQEPPGVDVSIRETRQALAERTGVSSKTVSRALRELERRGMLRLDGRRIRIGAQEREALYATLRQELELSPHDEKETR